MNDWAIVIAGAAAIISALSLFSRAMDKNLSIREHDAYRDAVSRDIQRVEHRLQLLEQTRPTTGELEILSDSLNKRIDELAKRTTSQSRS